MASPGDSRMRIKGIPLSTCARLLGGGGPVDWDRPLCVFLCVADHYEPMWGAAPLAKQRERVERWVADFPRMAAGLEDSAGRPPQHTFFYPAEDYTPELVEALAGLCREGYGDVEVHLHHDNDTPENLERTLTSFTEALDRRHGLLRRDASGRLTYGFIHGNWALDNSRPDGRWCGVNNELAVLKRTGCYADFTMPSAPSPTQTRMANAIYYARGADGRSKGHDWGAAARVGVAPPEDALLMVQGPLGFDWSRRKAGVLPRLENGDLHANFPPSLSRFEQWVKARVCVQGRPEWRFVKLHTHGAKEANADVLLGEPMRAFHEGLARLRAQRPALSYYYVTAWEMACLVEQAREGLVRPDLSLARQRAVGG